ncbi:collagen, type I, alpha 1a-like [Equus przewalskii]|uniref:Collagen, type I, alpha 1a-like n=1 Tax=Equus przewalskii TaxID=9798 RepID=A0ABM4PN86_EQUPR
MRSPHTQPPPKPSVFRIPEGLATATQDRKPARANRTPQTASPGGGNRRRGEERRHRNFPPRLERRRPGPGLGLPGRCRRSRERSPLRAPAGPPPPPAPPLPPVNGQRWSLNRALNHLNAICAPGPHLLPPTAARSVTPLPTGPARPPDPAANRAAAYSNRRAGAAPRMLRRPPLARPRGPTGLVVPVREVAGAESWAREWAAGGVLAASLARPSPGARCRSRPRRETQVPRGRAGGAVQAAVSIVSPPGTRRCLGTAGCAAAPGLLGPPPGSREEGSSGLGAALDPAWPARARRRYRRQGPGGPGCWASDGGGRERRQPRLLNVPRTTPGPLPSQFFLVSRTSEK